MDCDAEGTGTDSESDQDEIREIMMMQEAEQMGSLQDTTGSTIQADLSFSSDDNEDEPERLSLSEIRDKPGSDLAA